MTRPTVTYRAMSADEITMGRAVMPGRVTYLPGSAEKRFAWTMTGAADGDQQITEKQSQWLRRLVWRFRRQIPAAVRALVPEKPVGDVAEASFAPVPEYRNVKRRSCAAADDSQGSFL